MLLATACVDARGKFDAFVERDLAARMSDAGAVPEPTPSDGSLASSLEPAQIDGRYLFVVSTPLGRLQPTVLEAEVKAARKNGLLEISLRERHLAAADRKTPVEPFGDFRTYPVSAAGVYETDEIVSTTPAKANAVSPVESQARLVFRGQLGSALTADTPDAPVTFWCGSVDGELLLPFTSPLAGSTFTMSRIEASGTFPDIVVDCKMTPAEPL